MAREDALAARGGGFGFGGARFPHMGREGDDPHGRDVRRRRYRSMTICILAALVLFAILAVLGSTLPLRNIGFSGLVNTAIGNAALMLFFLGIAVAACAVVGRALWVLRLSWGGVLSLVAGVPFIIFALGCALPAANTLASCLEDLSVTPVVREARYASFDGAGDGDGVNDAVVDILGEDEEYWNESSESYELLIQEGVREGDPFIITFYPHSHVVVDVHAIS